MITKEQFIEAINNHKNFSNFIDNASNVLDLPTLFDSNFTKYTYKLFDIFIESHFNDYGIEDINWWLYEKDGNPGLKMFSKNDEEIPTETVDDLWNIVKEYRK